MYHKIAIINAVAIPFKTVIRSRHNNSICKIEKNHYLCAKEILEYAEQNNVSLKVIFINDGPGLLLGSMWDDYAKLENISPENIRVVTLRMVKERVTNIWLRSE